MAPRWARQTIAGPRERRSFTIYALTFVGRAARGLGRLAVFALAADNYAPNEVGLLFFLLALGSGAGIASDLGMAQMLTRDLPASGRDHRALVQAALRARMAAFVLATLVASAVAAGLGVPWLLSLGALLFAGSVSAADFFAAVGRARGHNEWDALDSAMPFVLALAAGWVAAKVGADFAHLLWAMGGTAGAWTILRASAMDARLGRRAHQARRWEDLIRVAWRARWFFLQVLAMWCLAESGILLLQWLGTAEDQALVGAALRTVGVMTQPFLVLALVYLPSLAHDRDRGKDALHGGLRELNLLLIVLTPAGYAVAVVVGEVLLPSFGAFYREAADILELVTIAYLVYLTIPTGTALWVVGRERMVVFISVVAVLVQVAVAVVLIPNLGGYGVAVAMLAALVVAKAHYVAAYFWLGLPFGDRRHVHAVLAVGAWVALLLATDGAHYWTVVGVAAAASASVGLWLLLTTRMFRTRS